MEEGVRIFAEEGRSVIDRIQEPPYCIKVELTEGCNLRCVFCGLNGIRGPLKDDKRFQFIEARTAERIAGEIARLGWRSRIEYALRGEPTLHPNAAGIVAIFRHHLPRTSLMMTSNGGGLLRKPGPIANINALFEAGLNCAALDDYDDANIVPKIRAASPFPNSITVYEYPADKRGNPYIRRKSDERVLTFLCDIRETSKKKTGVRDNLSNHCGAAAPINDRMAGKRCARPFRELAIRFDGQLMLCCNSWRGDTKIGSVMDMPLDELWQSPVLNAYRRRLYRGMRDRGECSGCDSKSWRVGLLPDPTGSSALPPPSADDERIIAGALTGPPLTEPVPRAWEESGIG